MFRVITVKSGPTVTVDPTFIPFIDVLTLIENTREICHVFFWLM